MFETLGFEVDKLIDADSAGLREARAAFTARSEGAETALIHFAGHGIQAENRNHLLTVDTLGVSLGATVETSVALDEMIAVFTESARAKVLMLDACRKPFRLALDSGRGGFGLTPAN